MLRLLTAVVALGLLTFARAPLGRALAKDGGLAVLPDAGTIGTGVQLVADFWQRNAPVQIFVGWSGSNEVEPSSFVGPIATTTSDSNGRWTVAMTVEGASSFAVPGVPGFVVYKAVSPTAAGGAATAPTEALGYFALIVGGHRPNGAGGVRLTIEGRAESAWLDWQPAGSETFYISHVGPFSPPLRDYLTNHLSDGDWDVVVPSTIVPLAATGGSVLTVQATLCASPSITCEPRPGRLRVVRVPVRNGEITDVKIALGTAPAEIVLPATGYAPAEPSPRRLVRYLALVMLVVGGAIVTCGQVINRRTMRSQLTPRRITL